MSTRMSAMQLIERAAECVKCGKVHERRQIAAKQWSWAAADGHSYATRLHMMTNRSAQPVLDALRQLAGE